MFRLASKAVQLVAVVALILVLSAATAVHAQAVARLEITRNGRVLMDPTDPNSNVKGMPGLEILNWSTGMSMPILLTNIRETAPIQWHGLTVNRYVDAVSIDLAQMVQKGEQATSIKLTIYKKTMDTYVFAPFAIYELESAYVTRHSFTADEGSEREMETVQFIAEEIRYAVIDPVRKTREEGGYNFAMARAL